MFFTPSSRRSFLLFCGGLLLAFGSAACQSSEAPVQPQTLTIGINSDNAPWGFEDSSGTLVGFEVDFMTAIADVMDTEIEFSKVIFIDLFPATSSGRIDLAMSSITVTDERLESFDFSQPYYDSDLSLVVTSDKTNTALDDLTGKTIAVNTGTTGEMWVDTHQEQYQFGEIVRYDNSIVATMDDLTNGIVEGYVTDIPAALYFTKTKSELEVVERIPTGEQYALMFSQSNPLRDEVNAAITTLKEDGTLAEIYEKWFGKAPDAETATSVVLPMP